MWIHRVSGKANRAGETKEGHREASAREISQAGTKHLY